MTVADRPRPGRPARLSRGQIIAAAIDGGVDDLTIRELAARLGVAHSALYRWVRNLDELFDLISEDIVDRILPAAQPTSQTWRDWLAELAWGMHDEFLAIPGYAARLARPHRHNPASFARLRDAVIAAFSAAGAAPDMAAQSWHIFGYGIVSWLGSQQEDHDHGGIQPRFDLFLDTLLRGLPAREPQTSSRPSQDHQAGSRPSQGLQAGNRPSQGLQAGNRPSQDHQAGGS